MKGTKTDRVIFLILNLMMSKGLTVQEIFYFLGGPSRSQGYKIIQELSLPNEIRPAVISKGSEKYYLSREYKLYLRRPLSA